MHFKLEQTIRQFQLDNNILEYQIKRNHLSVVRFYQPSKADQEIGHKPENAHCLASIEMQVSAKNTEQFKIISENRMMASDDKPKMSYIGPSGERINLPSYSEFPSHFTQFLDQVHSELSEAIREILGIIRWRCGILGPHQAISHRGFFWSTDNQFWHPAPSDIRVSVQVNSHKVIINPSVNDDIKDLIHKRRSEPVHHELFREAWKLRDNDLRSSLLIGFTSLEVAVKNCISELVPKSKWLVENLPSPPIDKILREYFGQLSITALEKAKIPSVEVLDTIKNGIVVRNSIAHLGSKPPKPEKIQEFLVAIRECIWIMDYNTGNSWALSNIKSEDVTQFI